MIDNLLNLLTMEIDVFEENISAMLDMWTSTKNMFTYSKYLGERRTWFSNCRYNVDQSSYLYIHLPRQVNFTVILWNTNQQKKPIKETKIIVNYNKLLLRYKFSISYFCSNRLH